MSAMNRRRVVLSATAVIVGPYVARADASDTVRFGVLYPNLTTVIHEIAKRTGAYERQKLNVVETRFKSGQTVEGVEQLWRGNLDFYMGGAPEVPRLNSRLIEAGSAPPIAVVSGADPGHTSHTALSAAVALRSEHL
jgi:ABC-type nitrate/sulfonate/bicarbonate transport system substrate-binding protein